MGAGHLAAVMVVPTIIHWPPTLTGINLPVWDSLAHVSLFSMLIGFVFWYRGLARGGIGSVGQLRLLQPSSVWRRRRHCARKYGK